MTDDKHAILLDDPGHWDVRLVDVTTINIRADGYGESDGLVRFVALIAGTPPWELELVNLPAHVVRSIDGP